MSQYTDYFDRQNPSENLHRRLLQIPRKNHPNLLPRVALTACCLLALGLGLYLLPTAPTAGPVLTEPLPLTKPAADETSLPAPSARQLPELHYSTSASGIAADIALPEGHFQEELTQEALTALFGDTGWWEPLGWDLTGCAIYDGYGTLWQAVMSGTDGSDGWFSLALAPGQLPPSCVATEPEGANDIWGTQVSASRLYYDCDWDGQEEYRYDLSFLREETLGARLELTSETEAQGLIDAILIRLLDPDRSVTLDFLHPTEIPEWREDALSWEEAKQEPDFAAYVPESVPQGYQFESANLELGQDRYFMSLSWNCGYDGLSVTIDRAPREELLPVDPALPESYDVRLYDIPWADTVPEEYWQTLSNPIFRAEDMTEDLLAARAETYHDAGDTGTPRFSLSILHPDGILVRYTAKMSQEALWAILEPTLP